MNGPRVCLTYDFDAVASLQAGRAEGGPTAYSRRLFGAREGAPRVLDLLDRRDVTATWFVAGHTIESHGWRHVSPPEFESGRPSARTSRRSGTAEGERFYAPPSNATYDPGTL